MRRGIERLPAGNRRSRLDARFQEEVPQRLQGELLVDRAVAEAWGRIVARCETASRPIGAMDGFIAATAEAHGLTLVTRNVSDFKFSLKEIVNPWAGE
jgi:toxin FitB